MWTPSPVEVRRPIMASIGFSAIFIGDIPSGQPRITYFRRMRDSTQGTDKETGQGLAIPRDQTMNSPSRVIGFVNAAHFIDHYAMLIFAAAVIVMGPALGMAYSELLPYATPGFVAFGAGSLINGWRRDRWSRRHMMVIFFAGIGASMIAVGFVQTPLQLGAALLSIGLFASIYHPVGTAMIVSYADRLGREMGLNGVWGNLGVASSALVTGLVAQYLGWRWAFIIPGIVTILIGMAFARSVVHEDRSGFRQAAAQARVAKQDMWRVIVGLLIRGLAVSPPFKP